MCIGIFCGLCLIIIVVLGICITFWIRVVVGLVFALVRKIFGYVIFVEYNFDVFLYICCVISFNLINQAHKSDSCGFFYLFWIRKFILLFWF